MTKPLQKAKPVGEPPRRAVAHELRAAGWIVVAAFLVYGNSLWNDFTYDDVAIVRENPVVNTAPHWWAPWVNPYWPHSNERDRDDVVYRPLTIATYRWQVALCGLRPGWFHLVNVLLHALISVGVWRLARVLGASSGVACFAGLVFAVHPVHTEAVAGVVGRAELLAAGFGVLAVLLALAGNRCESKRGLRWRWVLAWLFALAALMSKESGAAILAVLAFIAMFPRSSAATRGAVVRRVLMALLPAMVIFGGYVAARYAVCGERLTVVGQRVAVGNPLRDADGWARALTPFAILGRYLALSLSPHRLLCDYSLNVFPTVDTLANGLYWVGLAFLVGCAVLGFRKSPHRATWRLLLVGFVTSYFLASNSLLLIDVIFAERLWYGPSLWLCVALALGLTSAVTRWDAQRWMWVGLGALLLVAWGLRTVVRNPDWRDSRTLIARDLAEMQPPHRSARLCAFRGEHLLAEGEADEAVSYLREAIAIFPDEARYHRLLGRAYLAMGKTQDAVTALREAVTIDPSERATITLLEQAELASQGRDLRDEYQSAKRFAEAHPNDVAALRAWARLAEVADPADAVRAYEQLTRAASQEVAHWTGLALAQYAMGDTKSAAATYEQVLKRWPDDWNAHSNLALLRMDVAQQALFDPEAALSHARRAVELAPRNWQLRVNLAEVTARCGDVQEAATMFEALGQQSEHDSTAQRLYLDRARHLRGN